MVKFFIHLKIAFLSDHEKGLKQAGKKIQATRKKVNILLTVLKVCLYKMVRPGRFERPTFALEGHCSIQLSYGRMGTAGLL